MCVNGGDGVCEVKVRGGVREGEVCVCVCVCVCDGEKIGRKALGTPTQDTCDRGVCVCMGGERARVPPCRCSG